MFARRLAHRGVAEAEDEHGEASTFAAAAVAIIVVVEDERGRR